MMLVHKRFKIRLELPESNVHEEFLVPLLHGINF